MTPDLAKLRVRADAATQPGPWSVSVVRHQARDIYTVLDANGFWVADVGAAPDDAAFIAAASPDVVLELLDLCELRGSEVAKWAHESGTAKGERDRLSGLVKDAALRDMVWATRLLEACDIADQLISARGGLTAELRTKSQRIAELRKLAEP